MTTLATVALPRTEFALAETLASVPGAIFEVEGIVETSGETVMPLMWAGAADEARLDQALRADPTTEHVELLSEYGERWLYRMEWTDSIQLLLELLLTNEAVILEASTSGEQWVLRIMFPMHDDVNNTLAYCEEHNLSLEIRSRQEVAGDSVERYGLTDEQYEILTAAWEQGYYTVPRATDLDTLAAELDISPKIASERLRRGIDAIVQNMLIADDRSRDVEWAVE